MSKNPYTGEFLTQRRTRFLPKSFPPVIPTGERDTYVVGSKKTIEEAAVAQGTEVESQSGTASTKVLSDATPESSKFKVYSRIVSAR
jgi:hypothetical protein